MQVKYLLTFEDTLESFDTAFRDRMTNVEFKNELDSFKIRFKELYKAQLPSEYAINYHLKGARAAALTYLSMVQDLYTQLFIYIINLPDKKKKENIEDFVNLLISIDEIIECNIPSYLLHKISHYMTYNISFCFSKDSFEFFNDVIQGTFNILGEKAKENLIKINSNLNIFLDYFFNDHTLTVLFFGYGDTIRDILKNNPGFKVRFYIDDNYTKEYYKVMSSGEIESLNYEFVPFHALVTKSCSPDLLIIGLEGTTSTKSFTSSMSQKPIPLIRLINSKRKEKLKDLLSLDIISIAITEDCKHELEKDYLSREMKFGFEHIIADFTDFDMIVTNIGLFGKNSQKLAEKRMRCQLVKNNLCINEEDNLTQISIESMESLVKRFEASNCII